MDHILGPAIMARAGTEGHCMPCCIARFQAMLVVSDNRYCVSSAQLTWFNHLLKTLWPHAGKTIVKEVMAQAKPALIDVCNQASAPL